MLLQELLGIVAALTQTHLAVVEPRTALLHDTQLDAEVEDLAQLGDALAEHDVELCLTERGRDLVLDDLGAGAVANERTGGVLQTLDAAHINTDARVIFQCAAAGRDLGVAVDDADLLAQLVDKDADGVCLADDTGQLAQRLTHQAGLQTDMAVTHLALDLGARHHGGNGVHNNGVDRAGADKCLADLHGLLAGVGLADQQTVNINAQRGGVGRIQRMLNINKRDLAAHLLGLGQNLQCQRGFTGGFGAVDLNDTAAGHAADAQRQIQAQTAGGDGIDLHRDIGAQLHNGALAELLFDLGQRGFQRGLFVSGRACRLGGSIFFCCHVAVLLLYTSKSRICVCLYYIRFTNRLQHFVVRFLSHKSDFQQLFSGFWSSTARSLPP